MTHEGLKIYVGILQKVYNKVLGKSLCGMRIWPKASQGQCKSQPLIQYLMHEPVEEGTSSIYCTSHYMW